MYNKNINYNERVSGGGNPLPSAALALLLGASATLVASCDLDYSYDYPKLSPAETPEYIYPYFEGNSKAEVFYYTDTAGTPHYDRLNITIKNSSSSEPAGFLIPLARTIYKQNPDLTGFHLSFPEMSAADFDKFLLNTTIGLMDIDKRTYADIQQDNEKDEYKAEHRVYAALRFEQRLKSVYGIKIDKAAKTIEIDLTQRIITTDNVATDENNIATLNEFKPDRVSFTVSAAVPEQTAYGYVGLYLNIDEKDPQQDEQFHYDPSYIVEYDLDLPGGSDDCSIALTQTDSEGNVTGQLSASLKGHTGSLSMSNFIENGLSLEGSASGQILENGSLQMTLPQDAQVTVNDFSKNGFVFNVKDNPNSYIVLDVADPDLDFVSSISLGITTRNSSGEQLSYLTDPKNPDYKNYYVEDLGLVNGGRRWKIYLQAMSIFAGQNTIESVFFKNVTNTSKNYIISAIAAGLDAGQNEHIISLPQYVDRNKPFSGLGYVLPPRSAVRSGTFSVFKVNGVAKKAVRTINDMNSKLQGVSITTYGTRQYVIQSGSGNFKP